MKSSIVNRIKLLKHEYRLGEQALFDLDAKQLKLKETLLRISGAIQVLEELLDECENKSVDVDHNIHPLVPPDPSEMDNHLPDAP